MTTISPRVKSFVKRIPYINRVAGMAHREAQVLLSRFPQSGRVPDFTGTSHLSIVRHGTIESYREWSASSYAEECRRVDDSLIPDREGSFVVSGHCAICERDSDFYCDFSWASLEGGRKIPNWRESLLCQSCGLRNRMRGCFHVWLQEFQPDRNASVYITEQLTPSYRWLKGRFPNTVGSEFISPSLAAGTIKRGVRHEDIQSTSFPDASFDALLSFEVLEHVFDPKAAFRDMARILKPGGRLFMTAPLDPESRDELVRARMLPSGSIEHLLEPEYHGNPMDPSGGALCFRHFGWSILEDLRTAGFSEAELLFWWSRDLAYLQFPQIAVTAVRA